MVHVRTITYATLTLELQGAEHTHRPQGFSNYTPNGIKWLVNNQPAVETSPRWLHSAWFRTHTRAYGSNILYRNHHTTRALYLHADENTEAKIKGEIFLQAKISSYTVHDRIYIIHIV